MNKYLLFLFALFLTAKVFSQSTEDSTSALDLITTPNSPGFTILGIAPQEIERPETPTDLAVNILSSTDNFSTLPQNYSLELSPAWIFFGKQIGYDDFASPSMGKTIAQTFTLSIATTDGFTSNDTRLGGGFRFSLFRGTIDTAFEQYQQKLDSAFDQLRAVNDITSGYLIEKFKSDSLYLLLDSLATDARRRHDMETFAKISVRLDEVKKAIAEDALKEAVGEVAALKKKASEIQVKRIGFKWDFAGASALDFVNNDFTNSYVTNTGLWTTIGFEKGSLTALATGRLMFQHENTVTLDAAMTNIDGGVRLLFDKGKFSFSGEVLYRQSIVEEGENDGQWKYDVNAAYSFMPNKTLTFSLGKNFDQLSTQYSGNLIAWLNVLIGLGAKRKVI
jgi:hypothetical protein